jgi:hypothetical protein
MAQLNLSVVAAGTSTYDLTALGTSDWIVYPNATPVRKNGGGSQIALAHVGSFSDSVATDSKEMSTWSDGAGTVSGSTNSLIFSGTGDGIGYALTVPADTNVRTVTAILGVYNTRMRITATLSDSSVAQQVDTSIVSDSSGGNPAAVTVRYAAASAGQTLTIVATQITPSGYANTSFQSAALSVPAAAITPGVVALALTGYAPSVVRGVTTSVAPGTASLAITGYAPSVTQGMTTSVTPAPAAMTISGYAPTVAQTAAQTVAPAPAGLAFTGYAPTVTRGASLGVQIGGAALVLTGYAPKISQANNVTPHYRDATILQLSAVRAATNLGPDRLQMTVDLV